ncbi:alternative ribosome rescue aminoacyl-tRNA hydrolase ArfB [Pedobacter puniceum]|uniref:Aminoacyl-tRNA hydrolase n=1 Tax=Pedobacter puniceum TaxID=2666136 RepID=A0A7K0FL00_9SPHI|nr:alternative ribosome rescue aminoacyl-tRNA hydrolase ArfB [Pedobacter puniceum]MRX45930.1 aminoacyl-tRNA hydrolase [Pedobacter puniceum]
MPKKPDFQILIQELTFKTSRSGGKGGQHVNKVSSKVELIWNINQTAACDEHQKQLLLQKLANRIDKEGLLHIVADDDRCQYKNKEIAIKRLLKLIKESLIEEKPRKPTKPSKAAVHKRLESKKKQALKKINRNIIWD